jgi:Na+-driven multidrug efflux pump
MNKKEQKQYEKLVLTPIPKLIPSLAVPTTVSMMITMIYNLVDAYFVGRLGTSASGSIGILWGFRRFSKRWASCAVTEAAPSSA